MILRNNSAYSFAKYQSFFMSIWSNAVAQGYNTVDAKTLAQLEWEEYVAKGPIAP